MLKATFLTLGFLFSLSAQTQTTPPPAPPACLSGTVMLGSVTLSCSAVDGTSKDGTYTVPSDAGALGFYVFQIRISSSDPDVLAVLVKLSVWLGDNPASQRIVAISPTGGKFAYTFALNAGIDGVTHQPIPPIVTAISIQELKSASSQSF